MERWKGKIRSLPVVDDEKTQLKGVVFCVGHQGTGTCDKGRRWRLGLGKGQITSQKKKRKILNFLLTCRPHVKRFWNVKRHDPLLCGWWVKANSWLLWVPVKKKQKVKRRNYVLGKQSKKFQINPLLHYGWVKEERGKVKLKKVSFENSTVTRWEFALYDYPL